MYCIGPLVSKDQPSPAKTGACCISVPLFFLVEKNSVLCFSWFFCANVYCIIIYYIVLFFGYFGMEKIGVGSRVSIPTLRSVCLIGLFSLLSGSYSSQEGQSDYYSFSNPDFIEAYTGPSSVLLDTTAARDKSVLYYHIARDKYGKFDVCERAMRVIALTPRIYAAGDAVGMSDQTKEYFRAKIFVESGGDSLAASTATAS